MKKVLLGLMALSMASFGASVNTLEEARGDDVKFKARNTTRLDRNRSEVEFNNIKLGKKTYIDYEYTGDVFIDGKGDQPVKGEHDIEVFTQLGDTGRFELYTNLEIDSRDGSKSAYIDVMPTVNLYRGDKGFSLVRAGMGYNWGNIEGGGDDSIRYVAEFKNIYTVNDRLELEANIYYTGEENSAERMDNKLIYEAYFYTNYPLYEADKLRVDALFEGGVDPYTFGQRETGGNESSEFEDGTDNYEDNYFYLQPTVRATYTTEQNVDVWVEGGYYLEETSGADVRNEDEDGGFIQIGVKTKF